LGDRASINGKIGVIVIADWGKVSVQILDEKESLVKTYSDTQNKEDLFKAFISNTRNRCAVSRCFFTWDQAQFSKLQCHFVTPDGEVTENDLPRIILKARSAAGFAVMSNKPRDTQYFLKKPEVDVDVLMPKVMGMVEKDNTLHLMDNIIKVTTHDEAKKYFKDTRWSKDYHLKEAVNLLCLQSRYVLSGRTPNEDKSRHMAYNADTMLRQLEQQKRLELFLANLEKKRRETYTVQRTVPYLDADFFAQFQQFHQEYANTWHELDQALVSKPVSALEPTVSLVMPELFEDDEQEPVAKKTKLEDQTI
jgi:hypothetical protein